MVDLGLLRALGSACGDIREGWRAPRHAAAGLRAQTGECCLTPTFYRRGDLKARLRDSERHVQGGTAR